LQSRRHFNRLTIKQPIRNALLLRETRGGLSKQVSIVNFQIEPAGTWHPGNLHGNGPRWSRPAVRCALFLEHRPEPSADRGQACCISEKARTRHGQGRRDHRMPGRCVIESLSLPNSEAAERVERIAKLAPETRGPSFGRPIQLCGPPGWRICSAEGRSDHDGSSDEFPRNCQRGVHLGAHLCPVFQGEGCEASLAASKGHSTTAQGPGR